MDTTPPPPDRARTPPTPLHGARYDNYEPYSPRRSSRVAAQRKHYSQQQLTTEPTLPKSLRSPRTARASTPTSSRKQTLTRTSSQTFSPPSSPCSPIKHSIAKSPRSGTRRRISNSQKQQLPASAALDSDSDNVVTSNSHQLSAFDPRAMLPTPAKTPRKRAIQSQAALSSTARVLFPNRPATVDDAMPSPRKTRKNKKHSAFTLQSFVEEVEDEGSSSKIEIYTDSKERVPDLDEDEDNPFITSKKNGKARSNGAQELKRRKVDERTARMEEAARNDEGVIYVFRGRKIFRKFNDGPPSTSSDDANLSEQETRRRAGADVHRPFTRSSIKPRLLFPNEDQRRERELAADEADEEAVTDIEVPVPSSAGKRKAKHDEVITPVKQNFRPATPPSTGRVKRGRKKDVDNIPHAASAMDIDEHVEATAADIPEEEELQTPPLPPTRGKKNSPFDSWQRVKPTSRLAAGKGMKREGEALDRQGEGKRSRNGMHAGSGSASADV